LCESCYSVFQNIELLVCRNDRKEELKKKSIEGTGRTAIFELRTINLICQILAKNAISFLTISLRKKMRFQSSEDESSSSFEEKKNLLQVAAEVENGYMLVDLKSFSSVLSTF